MQYRKIVARLLKEASECSRKQVVCLVLMEIRSLVDPKNSSGPVAELVGIRVGIVSGVINLESSGSRILEP